MPRYTLSIRSEDLDEARRLSFSVPEVEGACFLLCGESRTENEVRLLCKEVVPVADDAYLVRRPDFLSLDSPCYVAAAKRAREEGLALVFVHSHPGGWLGFSKQDDREEPKLQEFFKSRVPGRVHAGLVLTETGVIGRVWVEGRFEPLELVRVVGKRFGFHFSGEAEATFPEYFDRQVRAFGTDVQAVLSRIHVGIVGVGGTGSPSLEQLTRLGVGKISVFDGDTFESSNVNRVYGSGVADEGKLKVDIGARNVEHIGVGTDLVVVPRHITEKEVALALRDCDIVFGCTDKEAPRAILTQLALRYIIPVFDMGVLVNSTDGHLTDVIGRVTTLMPGEACLFCRGRITPEVIAFEMLPEERKQQQIAHGYAPELATRNPAVVPFTTSVASIAVTELLHRLTGFMGANRESSEVLQAFDRSRLSTNREASKAGCSCTERELWGSGDSDRYLGMWN